MAKISKPANFHSAGGATPSAVPDGAGSAPDIERVEPVAAPVVDELDDFLAAAAATIPDAARLHASAERLATVAAQAGDQANNGKLSRLANVLAEFRNGLIASLS